MWNILSEKNQVAGFEPLDTVAHKTHSPAFQHQHDFVFRMEMPGGEEKGFIHP